MQLIHCCGAHFPKPVSLVERCTLQHNSDTLQVFFPATFYLSLSDNNPHKAGNGNTGLQNVCMCLPSMLLPAHIFELYTLPPVILAPTTTGIIAHFLRALCVWLPLQGFCPSMCVLLALKVSAGS